MSLGTFFSPRGIALVGASDDSTWSRNLVASLRQGGASAAVVAVHPTRDTVLGLPTYRRLADVAEPVDLAWLLVSPKTVPAVLAEAAEAGLRHAVVLAAGYREAGAMGEQAQRALTERAAELGVTLLGPNCMGFVNARAGVAALATTVPVPPLPGGVSVVMQSGALAGSVLEYTYRRGIGLHLLVSTGNEAGITTADLIDHLAEDPDTRAIALFTEGIGDAGRFRAAAARALAAGKPVVALHAGRTEQGRGSALAHTGALGTEDAIVDAALRQFGVVRVDSLEELLSTAALFAHLPTLPAGGRVAIVTASGGAADLAVDRVVAEGLTIPEFGDDTRTALAPLLPAFSTVRNPLDVTGFQSNTVQKGATKTIDEAVAITARDPDVDVVLNAVLLPQSADGDRRITALGELVRSAPVPVVTCSYTHTDLTGYQRDTFPTHGLHLLGGIDLATRALGHVVRWSARRARPTAAPAATGGTPPDAPAPVAVPPGGAWAEDAARAWVWRAGVPVVPAILVRSADAAVAAADELEWPVVLKVCSAQIPHKSDVDGVALELRTPAAVREAYDRVVAGAARVPGAEVKGVLVSPMRRGGVELFAGVHVDPTFGAVLSVGTGGVWVEVLRDVAHRVLPVGPDEVREMLRELRAYPMLAHPRGGPRTDLDAVARAVLGVAAAAAALGASLAAVEVNPLRVHGSTVEALDALVVTTAG